MHILKLVKSPSVLTTYSKSISELYSLSTRANVQLTSNCGLIRAVPQTRFLSSLRSAHTSNLLKRTCLNTKFLTGVRFYVSKESDDEHRGNSEEHFNPQLPATVAVPDVWPHVPVIAINRNIVFPRFIKLIEV